MGYAMELSVNCRDFNSEKSYFLLSLWKLKEKLRNSIFPKIFGEGNWSGLC